MRNLIKYTTLTLLAVFMATASYAQAGKGAAAQGTAVKGVVFDANTKEALQFVQISSPQAYATANTGPKGGFSIRMRTLDSYLTASKEGYFQQQVDILGRDSIVIYLQRSDETMSTDRFSTANGEKFTSNKLGTASAINTKDLSEAYSVTSNSLVGQFPGFRVINKSGLPGEGSFINMRGVRSFFGQNTPALVVDGIPYKPDQTLSNVINGFSADILDPINVGEIEQITLLKGADALPFGSLGSNGVLMIETVKGIANQTQVEVRTTQGVSFLSRQIPMMDATDFKSYITDIGTARYGNHNQLLQLFPFLRDDLTLDERLSYGNNTNWQDEIYKPAFTSDNVLTVRGGDAVVRYLLTAGYNFTNGVVYPTNATKFFTRANTHINFNEKLTATASIAFDYTDMTLVEQGMTQQTNPLLAAYGFSPFSSPYQYKNGKELDTYTKYDTTMLVSNPVAMQSEIQATARRVDMLINAGIAYKFRPNLVLDVKFGLYYDYKKEDMFAGGRTSKSIAPMMEGVALNTVRSGSTETKNYYGKMNLRWDKTFAKKHNVAVDFGGQLMADKETASSGFGYNTSGDKFRNLNGVLANSRRSTGYVDVWNWANGYLTANYNYNYQIYASATAMVDAASTYGRYSARAFVFPAVQLGWKMSNASFLRNSSTISHLMLRGEYSINPNSRFDSRYSKYYYVLQLVRQVSGIVRAGVPNMKIEPEKVHNLNIGVDFSTVGDKFMANVDLFQETTKDMLIENNISSVYGYNTMFKNNGEIRTRGVEVGASALIFGSGNFKWRLGANVGHYKSVIRSLGGVDEQIIDLDNGVTIINRIGETPYSFYGHESKGVYASNASASNIGYKTTGGYQYQGGDIMFEDRDGDGIISEYDRKILGSATPDFYGSIFSKMSYKNLTLYMNWGFTYGNDIYNAVRRENESGTQTKNQAQSMARRWRYDGQVTDIPRVTFVDGGQNNRFSSRWIEDGSYLKLKEVTLSYDFNKKVLFLTGLKIYVTAENLFTFTKYTGSDPEFSYSYDMELQGMDLGKIPVPKSVKLGLILNF